jgi:hypothetical protein
VNFIIFCLEVYFDQMFLTLYGHWLQSNFILVVRDLCVEVVLQLF